MNNFFFSLGAEWSQFKSTFNKSYADENEENYRRQIFLHNQEIIVAHNAQYEQGLETYSLCVNKFGDWLHDEYIGINGLDLSQKDASEDESESDESNEDGDDGSHGSHGEQQHCSECQEQGAHGAHGSSEGRSFDGSEVNQSSSGSSSDNQQNGNSASSGSAGSQGGSAGSQGGNAGGQEGNAGSQGGSAGNQGGKKSASNEQGGEAPDKKDWRDDGAVTSVKDQLKCASCWAFSAAGALEGQFFLKNGVLESLSEQELVDCSRKVFNNGCNTGFMTNAFLYTKSDGIHTEAEYPYEAKDAKCRTTPNEKKNKKLKTIKPKGDEQELKKAVGTVGPVSVGLDALNDKFMFYGGGVYFNPECKPEKVSHAVLAIGYGTDEKTGMDYWLIKNSYGTTWGEEGYGKVARNKDNHCGIASLASYPIV